MSDQPTRTVPPLDQPTADAPARTVTPDPGEVTSGLPRRAPNPVPRLAPPGYELHQAIGSGGMGIVYRARDVSLDRDVAVKLLSDKYAPESLTARRFLSEARITAQLQHPGIPAVHQVGTLPDGRPFLAMKLIKGRTLDELLKQRPDPTADRGRLLAAFEQVCQAVGYAHAHMVVHRDLKPSNVMVGAFGEVQVMDWGLAKVLTTDGTQPLVPDVDLDAKLITEIRSTRDEDAVTQAGSLLGTPAFMPPEQAIGAVDQIDARSDVFGLGTILCAILTGKPPYVGANSESTRQLAARANLGDAFARLAACGAEPELVALCKRCLAVEKADRPPDAEHVAEAVAKLRAAAEERARQAEVDRAMAEVQVAEQRKRRRIQLALAGAIGLLLLGGGAVAWWRDRAANVERERLARNSDVVAAMLGQCEDALRADDPATAALTLEAAEKRAPEGGAENLTDRLARCRDDLTLLGDLDRVDALRWTWVEGNQVPPDEIKKGWAEAFARWGVVPGTTPPAEAAQRVTGSLVADRALAALDRWLASSHSADLLAILRAADPEQFRDAVREAVATGAGRRVADLARRPEALSQPTRFAAVLGDHGAIPMNRRKLILGVAVQRRPGDFGLLMTRGTLTSETDPEREPWLRAAVAVRPGNAVAHQNLGHALKAKGDFDGAVVEFKEMIRLDPKLPWAHHWLVDTLITTGEVDWAVAYYEEAIRRHPSEAWAYAGLSNALWARGDRDRAVAFQREVIRLEPADSIAHFTLGRRLSELHDFSGAEAPARESIRLNPNFLGAYESLGNVLLNQRDFDGAIIAYKEGLRHDPTESTNGFRGSVRACLANALRQKGDLEGALAVLKEARRLHPNSAAAYTQFGHLLRVNGDLDGGIGAYKKAIELDPKDGSAWHNLGIALYAKKDFVGAVAAYKRFFELQPTYAPAYNDLGDALMRTGDVDGAIAAYKEVIRLDPKWSAAHVRTSLGRELTAKGNLDEAISILREAIGLDPNAAWVHFHMGEALRGKKDLDGAIECCREEIRIDPNGHQGHLGLGEALAAKGDLDGAIKAYQEAIRLNAKHAHAHAGLGAALQEKGDWDAAIAAYWAAIRLNADDASIPSRMRECYAAKGSGGVMNEARKLLTSLYDQKDLDAAVTVARFAIRLSPNEAHLHFTLGRALRDKGDLNGAVASFREAVRLDRTHSPAQRALANALFDKKDYDAAIPEFKETIRLDPKNPHWYFQLGQALKEKGDVDGAIVSFREALQIDPKRGYFHQNLGDALTSKGDLDGAIAAFKAAVRLEANNPYVRRQLAWLFATGPDSIRDGKRAVELATRACELTEWQRPWIIDVLAAAHAEAGDFDKAVELENKALCFAGWANGDGKDARQRLELYQQKKPYQNPGLVRRELSPPLRDPKYARAYFSLGRAFGNDGDWVGAVESYQEAIRLDPKGATAHNVLAWLLATGPDGVRDGRRAVEHGTRACELTSWKEPNYIDTLAAAYAEAGDFDKAVDYQKKALAMPAFPKTNEEDARRRLDLYAEKKPYHDPALAGEVAPAPREVKEE